MDANPIVLGTSNIKSHKGVSYPCTFTIDKSGHIPDVYIKTVLNIEDEELYSDDTFIKNCMKFFKSIGYTGKSFGRCELGMQGDDYIVLEPNNEFRAFVVDKFDWYDLEAHYVNELISTCPQCGGKIPKKTEFTSCCKKCEYHFLYRKITEFIKNSKSEGCNG